MNQNPIQWHSVTWYSKLGAILLFVLALPVLTFYIGVRYEETLAAVASENASLASYSVPQAYGRPAAFSPAMPVPYPGISWNAPKTVSFSAGSVRLHGVLADSAAMPNVTDVAKAVMPFEGYYDGKLRSAGYIEEQSLDADGAGSSSRVYVKEGKYVIISYISESSSQDPNAPLACPCDLTLSVFEGMAQ